MEIPPDSKTPPNVPKDHPHWTRMRFKRNKVWMATDADQQPLIHKGKALIKYQLDQPHEYWVHFSKMASLDDQAPGAQPRPLPTEKAPKTPSVAPSTDASEPQDCHDAICIYTDGACSGNPGPAGIGVVLRYKDNYREISRNIGMGTNNVAELEAIKAGLMAVKNRAMPAVVFTDSQYAFGLLTQGWKAKQNTELVGEIRQLMTRFKRLRFVKVKGHAGHPDNERADRLAVKAVQSDLGSI